MVIKVQIEEVGRHFGMCSGFGGNRWVQDMDWCAVAFKLRLASRNYLRANHGSRCFMTFNIIRRHFWTEYRVYIYIYISYIYMYICIHIYLELHIHEFVQMHIF